jgi:hypothetical protein
MSSELAESVVILSDNDVADRLDPRLGGGPVIPLAASNVGAGSRGVRPRP